MELTLASDWEDNSEEWLIPQLLCDSITLLSGEPKSGKTALACHLIRSLITKEPILNVVPTQKKLSVVWMGFDSRWQREVKERVPDLLEHIYFASPKILFRNRGVGCSCKFNGRKENKLSCCRPSVRLG